MPNKIAVTQTYQDVERFVRKLVAQAVERHRLDMDDVIEAAYLGFMQAFGSYNPSKGEFITWCGEKVKKRILDLIRTRGKEHNRAKNRVETELEQIVEKETVTFDREGWLESLSEDGRLVALLVLDPPIDVRATLAQLGNDSPGNWRYAMRDFLRDMGWTVRRTMDAFREVKGAL